MSNKLLPRLAIPHQDTANPAPISQKQRLDLLQRLLTAEETALLTRVAAVLTLLYAQPLTRILSLTVDDVLHQDGEVRIRLGEPPAPVPEPFASLLLRYAGQRLNLTTAANADARWLFPGRRGGQPMTRTASKDACTWPASPLATGAPPRCASSSSRLRHRL